MPHVNVYGVNINVHGVHIERIPTVPLRPPHTQKDHR